MKRKFIPLLVLAVCCHLSSYAQLPEAEPEVQCLAMPVGMVQTPYWQNVPGKIYVKCPNELAVGIGTTNPRSKLDVIGTTQTSKLSIGADPATMVGRFHMKVTSSPTNASTLFLIENTQRKLMQLNNQGLLQVREVKVDLLSWPDYVFKSTYRLMPLNEVETYIRVEGHLPNVPAACEIEENGLEIGQMNKILMEKVEELTLYLIEQQKLLEGQQQRIKELEVNMQKGQ
jgi:hypothetical protein